MQQRIMQIIKRENLSIRNFERKISTSSGVISKSLRFNTDFSVGILIKIAEIFPQYSSEWLLRGNGPMLKEDSSSAELDEVSKNYKQIAEAQERLITSLEKQIERLEAELAKRDAPMDGDAGCAGADMSETA
jgi:uncharacterized small protein (DUF1192 family)